MLDPLQLIQISPLLAATTGRSETVIGAIDGPVASHPDLQNTNLQTLSTAAEQGCESVTSSACAHGTFIAGILSASRESQAPGLCPDCSLVLRPIFCEVTPTRTQCPEVTPQDLAAAIVETVDAGVRAINLSLGLADASLLNRPELKDAFNYAFKKGVLLIAASGNQGRIGPVPLFSHPWVIPVAACDLQGRLQAGSNIGPSVGKRGLMAPGVGIVSTAASGGYTTMSGTSVAVPFVTGTAALLWSLFPQATAAEIRDALLLPRVPRKSVNPPLLNAAASWRALSAPASI